MLTAFLTTLEQMIRIFLFLLMGYGLNRLHILPKEAHAGISKLVTTILLPAILLYTNMTEFQLSNIGNYSRLVLLGALLWLGLTGIAFPIAKMLANGNRNDKNCFLYGLTIPNTGAVGTPLALALWGNSGLFQFNLLLFFCGIMTYSWGINLFLDVKRNNPVKRFFISMANPVFLSMIAGFALGALGAPKWMPPLVSNFIGDLGDCYVPLSLLVTGYSIADYPMSEVFRRPRSYVYTLLRLIVFPLLVLVVLKLIGTSQSIAALAVIAFACPCGMNVVVFPAAYKQDCRTGSSIVLLSSLGSILTVPVFYAIVQWLFST